MDKGGLSNWFAEPVATFKRSDIGNKTGNIYAVREATFSDDMSGIESRYLRHIAVVNMDGYAGREYVWEMSRDEATELRNALDLALVATRDDKPIPMEAF